MVLSFNSKRELKVSDMEGLVVVWGTVIFIFDSGEDAAADDVDDVGAV